VGVGPPRPLDHLSESFRLATRALVTAESLDLTGIQDIQSLGLRAAVAADWDVGDALCGRYIEPLAGVSSGPEILDSLRKFIACGMHVERAAELLVIHPNTLRYRISRFEELTSCSLREPGTAFEVWWALERAEMRPNTSRVSE
jgi:DNA-binding PucR family transcriptional regulator